MTRKTTHEKVIKIGKEIQRIERQLNAPSITKTERIKLNGQLDGMSFMADFLSEELINRTIDYMNDIRKTYPKH